MTKEPKKIVLEDQEDSQESETQILPPTIKKEANPAATSTKPLLHSLENMPKSSNSKNPLTTILLAFLIVSLGIGSGYALNKARAQSPATVKQANITKTAEEAQEQGVKVGDVIGNPDAQTFKDKAEGVVVKGGVDGEGSHHLLRPGGPSQSVYLTSSVFDLDQLDGHKVKIWGETFAARKAGWLMDVGRVEVVELNAEKPFEEKAN